MFSYFSKNFHSKIKVYKIKLVIKLRLFWLLFHRCPVWTSLDHQTHFLRNLKKNTFKEWWGTKPSRRPWSSLDHPNTLHAATQPGINPCIGLGNFPNSREIKFCNCGDDTFSGTKCFQNMKGFVWTILDHPNTLHAATQPGILFRGPNAFKI